MITKLIFASVLNNSARIFSRTFATVHLIIYYKTGPMHIVNQSTRTEMRGPIPMTAPSTACVCGRSLAGIAGSNPDGNMDVCLSCDSRVLLDKGLCDGLMPRPEESYRVWCVCVCHWGDQMPKKTSRPTPTMSRRKEVKLRNIETIN
jgi:hypothetical protein